MLKSIVFNKIVAMLSIFAIAALVIYDARFHFDADLIHVKRQNKSAQKNWNIFFGQSYVYADSAFRYEADFAEIEKLLEPFTSVFADISSSYFASTYLPVYIKNIHRHHGRDHFTGISALLNSRQMCYLQDPKNIDASKQFFKTFNASMRAQGLSPIRYFIINRDDKNLNLRQDCLWTARERLIKFVGTMADLKFEGEHLNFYEIKKDLQ